MTWFLYGATISSLSLSAENNPCRVRVGIGVGAGAGPGLRSYGQG